MGRWRLAFVILMAGLPACISPVGAGSQPAAASTPTPSPYPTATPVPTSTPPDVPAPLSPTPLSYQGVPLPDLCRPPSEDQPSPCRDLQFSPDGRYLGLLTAPPSEGHVMILDAATGDVIYPFEEGSAPGGHRFEFLPDGRVLLFEGHYEGGEISLLDPDGRTRRALGDEGSVVWNPQRTAFAVMAIPHIATSSQVWGYNLETDFVFKPPQWGEKYEVFPTWTPDGGHLLYAYRPFDGSDVYAEPSRIQMVDAGTGEITTVLFQPEYDFHICNPARDDACPPQQGDWIAVRRVPFPTEPQGMDIDPCVYLGEGCPGAVVFLLNWRTGELKSVDEP